MDSYKPHRAEEGIEITVKTCKSDVVVIPGGCTSIIQPMDKCINKPFKTFMQQQWQEWIIQDRPTTKAGNLKQLTRQDIINWVSHAWSSIELKVIVDSFLVCGLSNTLDGSQDDKVSDDIPACTAEDGDSETEDQQEEEEGRESEGESDVDEMGDPFSDLDDSDCEQ